MSVFEMDNSVINRYEKKNYTQVNPMLMYFKVPGHGSMNNVYWTNAVDQLFDANEFIIDKTALDSHFVLLIRELHWLGLVTDKQ